MESKKTFLIINQTAGSPYHGMVYRNYYIAREWVKQGHKAVIISGSYFHNFTNPPKTTGLFTKEMIDGIEYWWVKLPKYSESRSIGRLLTLFYFPWLLLLFPFWKLAKPETVIVSGPPHLSIFNAWVWARYWGSTLIYEVRDIWPLTIIKLGGVSPWHPVILFLSFFEKLAYMAADRVVSVLALAGEYFETRGMRPVKFAYIPNGVDISELKKIESPTSEKIKEIASSKKVVIYTGSFGIANNLEQFLDAAMIMETNPDVHFVLVGDGPFRKHLEEKGKNLKNVSFFASVPKNQIPSILEAASICYVGLMKSDLFQHGVSPNKLFDYMAASKPVIMAIDTKDNIVEKANCGIHVPSCSPEDIAQAVSKLASKSNDELQVLGSNARLYLEKNHTYSSLAKRYVDVAEEGRKPVLEASRWAASPFWIGVSIVAILGSVFHLVLPLVFPSKFRDGIIVYLKDPQVFHELAIATAKLSWTEFTLFPLGQFPAGFLALLYKITGIHKPFMALPILAGLAGLTIRGIASCLDVLGVRGRWWPLLIGIAFTVTPTSLSWMIYPHKDSFIVPGVILLTWTFIAVAARRILIRHFVIFALGSFLVFSSKSYYAEIFFVGTLLSLPFAFKKPTSELGRYGTMAFYLFALSIFGYVYINKSGYTNNGDFTRKDLEESSIKTSPLTNYAKETWVEAKKAEEAKTEAVPRYIDTKDNWKNTIGGELINKPLRAMAFTREKFLYEREHANTNFHPEIHLTSSIDTILYIPRAFQLAILEPLPFSNSEGEGAKELLYVLVKIEMLVVYLCLFFLIFSGRRSLTPTVIICLAIALPFLVAFGMAVPNVGTINRYRFPFLIIIKLAGLAALWNSSRFKWPGRLLKWIDPPEMNREKKILCFLVPDDDTFVIQRLVMAQAAQKAGFEVHVACPDLGHAHRITALGFIHHNVELNRGGLNPVADFSAFIKLTFFLAKLRPDVLHNVSIKPVIYGATAGTIVGLNRIVCLINGLGYAFEAKGLKGKIVLKVAKALYRNALALPGVRVIFQNPDDRDYFVENKLVDAHKTRLIRGSGVNTTKFAPTPQPQNDKPVVLYVGRLLRSKGIDDLINAAIKLKALNLQFVLRVVGQPDDRNPEALPKDYLEHLQKEGVVELMGRQSDMPKFYREADMVVLPQQNREGLPLTLLEASCTGRAIIATDVPGCREVIRDGVNGFKVPPKNPDELGEAIKKLIENPELRKQFGEKGSQIVEEEFSAEIVQKQLILLYVSLFPTEKTYFREPLLKLNYSI